METDALIEKLSAEATPVGRFALEKRLGAALVAGAAATFALMQFWLGVRPDLAGATHTFPFWLKAAYVISLAAGGVVLTLRLARPNGRLNALGILILIVPIFALSGISFVEFMRTTPDAWRAAWLGATARECPLRIVALSLPLFSAAIWAFRRYAPMDPTLAGAASGVASGALAAAIYALHCPETSPSFILTWYTLGVSLSGVAGALGGRWLFRW